MRCRDLLRRCHGDTALAEDLAGETFTRATRAFLGWRGEDGTAAGWLLAIARSTHLDHLRRKRLPVVNDEAALAGLVDPREPPSVDEVEATLGAMPPRAAGLLRLVYLDGFTPAEVGVMTGQRPEAVRTALWRSRSMFRAAWEAGER